MFPEQVDSAIVDVLESHIEGMEPQFRSASFSHLWHALKEPLTRVFRLRGHQDLLFKLDKCSSPHKSYSVNVKRTLQSNHETAKKALIVCKINEMLSYGTNSDKSDIDITNTINFKLLWQLLYKPLTELLSTRNVSTLLQEIKRYNSRFELAGINYRYPTKMSDVMRDVLICKLDDILNEVFVQFTKFY